LIPSFVKLLKDAEPEVRTVAAKSLVGVCSLLPQEIALNEIIPATKCLVTDPSQHVRGLSVSFLFSKYF
jgi:HEAT repeat protein